MEERNRRFLESGHVTGAALDIDSNRYDFILALRAIRLHCHGLL